MAAHQERIEAGDITMGSLYENYLFEIPNYQRAFSWEDEHFDQLIDDLLEAYDRNREDHGPTNDNLDEFEPYFLGSLILQRLDQTDRFDVVDGQQRLTSLAILMAVLRDELEGTNIADNLHTRLYEEGDAMTGKPERYRLSVRKQEREFFEEYIVSRGGTKNLDSIDKNRRSEPEQRFLEAVEIFQDRLSSWHSDESPQKDLAGFAGFLGRKLTMVEIKTGSKNSAFRLFNVVNARGLPLSTADLLKSENLGEIPKPEEDDYTKRWVDIEEEVGSETLDTFISMIRHLKVKRKAQKSVYDEFEEIVFHREPDFRGKPFIEYLEEVHDIYDRRVSRKIVSPSDPAQRTRYETLVSIVESFYPSEDWMMGMIKFDQKFSDEDGFVEFFDAYERKIATDWVGGLSLSERLTQLYDVVRLIESADTVNDVISDDLLTSNIETRKEDFLNTLNADNFYRKGNYQMARYVLLRLDMERYDLTDVARYRDSVTVEHILPRTPTDEYWQDRFEDEAFRLRWTHRLGNLVPLNQGKNSSASNLPFPEKVSAYLSKRSDFQLVNELEENEEWTPDQLQNRHEALKQEAIDCWF